MSEIGGWMLLIIFGSIIGCAGLLAVGAFALCWITGEFKEDKTIHKISVFGTLVLVTGAILGCSLGFGITNKNNVIKSEYNDLMYEIVSLERGSEIHGSFVLGTGSINSKQVYYVYKKTTSGYKLESVDTEFTYIRESNDVTPGVYHWKASGDFRSYYHIWCPEGTVVQQYKG